MKMKNFANRGVVALMAMLPALLSAASNLIMPKSVDDFAKASAVYKISTDINLSGRTLVFPEKSVLIFDGGSLKNGKIKFAETTIEAFDYKIFENITSYSGTIVNHEINADWFGAADDCSSALNSIISLGENRRIVLPRQQYNLKSSVIVDKSHIEIECLGKIVVTKGGCSSEKCAFDLRESFISLNLGQLIFYDGASGTTCSSTLSAIRLSGNVYHSNITVNQIYKFDIGINLAPMLRDSTKEPNGVGVQYNKISWQQINCNTGINIDLWRNTIPSKIKGTKASTVWVNENLFFGGRLIGKNGIMVDRAKSLVNEKADVINGNVFNCIGFEGITEKPMSLYGMTFCEFNDIRMSESLPKGDGAWIDLDRCSFMKFSLKSMLDHKRISAKHSHQITFYGCFTDKGFNYTDGNTVLFINNSNPANFLNDDKAATTSVSTTHVVSRGLGKNLYYDVNSVPNKGSAASPVREITISYDDLFLKKYDGQLILSDACTITLYDQVRLRINLDNSIYNQYSNLLISCDLHNHSEVIVVKDGAVVDKISSSGTYKILKADNKIALLKFQ